MIPKKSQFAIAPPAHPNIPRNTRMSAIIGMAVTRAVKVLIKTRIAGQSRQTRIQMIKSAIPRTAAVIAALSNAGLTKREQPQAMKLTEANAINARARISRRMQMQPKPPPPGGLVVFVVGVDVVVDVGLEVVVDVGLEVVVDVGDDVVDVVVDVVPGQIPTV